MQRLRGQIGEVFMHSLRWFRALSTGFFLVSTLWLSGCGSNPPGNGGSPFSGNTQVTILVSSTSPGDFVEFRMNLVSLKLKDNKGNEVALLPGVSNNTSLHTEFIPFNGVPTPLITASVPQGQYTSASITVEDGTFMQFLPDASGTLTYSYFGFGYSPTTPVINLNGPLTIQGNEMILNLDLNAVESAHLLGLQPNGYYNYTITPTFNLTQVLTSNAPTTANNKRLLGILGRLRSIGSHSASLLRLSDGSIGANGHLVSPPPIDFTTDEQTSLQGFSAISSLPDGALVDMDLSLREDGSFGATRIEALDNSARNLYGGRLTIVSPTYSDIDFVTWGQNGEDLDLYPSGNIGAWGTSTTAQTVFRAEGEFAQLSSLPFNTDLSLTTLFPGQEIAVTNTNLARSGGQVYDPAFAATSITLMPQVINGTITSISSQAGFNTYTVQLTNTDALVRLGQPSLVTVYADANAAILTTTTPTVGTVARFRGLLFKDGSALRMACNQINTGAPLH